MPSNSADYQWKSHSSKVRKVSKQSQVARRMEFLPRYSLGSSQEDPASHQQTCCIPIFVDDFSPTDITWYHPKTYPDEFPFIIVNVQVVHIPLYYSHQWSFIWLTCSISHSCWNPRSGFRSYWTCATPIVAATTQRAERRRCWRWWRRWGWWLQASTKNGSEESIMLGWYISHTHTSIIIIMIINIMIMRIMAIIIVMVIIMIMTMIMILMMTMIVITTHDNNGNNNNNSNNDNTNNNEVQMSLRFNTLHYRTLHYTTLHYTTTQLHYTTLHNTTTTTTQLHSTTLHYTKLHYTTLHYITLVTTLHSTTLHYTTLHCTTLHCTTLHYTEWQQTGRQTDR